MYPLFGAQELSKPFLLFLGDACVANQAKTAFGIRDWARHLCVGEFSCGATVTAGLPALSPQQAYALGARSLVIGVVNLGGVIPDGWMTSLFEAMDAGLDIVSGMHDRLGDNPELASAARQMGRRLIDVRVPPQHLPVGTGRKRRGRRLLTVGTDCALGKKYTALSLARAFVGRGLNAEFRATGQTGILISGAGIPIDAVIGDFLAGAAETLTPDADEHHWDVVEGQGSIFHPSYAGVSVGLLHGTQPDVFVVCDEPGRPHMAGLPDYRLPDIQEVIDLTLAIGQRTNPSIRCGGVSLNTSALDSAAAEELIMREAGRLGLAVADPIRGGPAFDRLVEACLATETPQLEAIR